MAYGDGTIQQNTNGTWTMRVVIEGRRYKRTAPTKTDVRAKVAKLRNGIATGEAEAEQKRVTTTVTDVVADLLDLDLPGRPIAPSTIDRHRQSAAHVNRLLGNRRIVDLTVRDVEAAFTALAAEGQSRASIVKVSATASQAIQGAVRRGDLNRNVVRDALIPASAARTVPRRSLTPDDARTLLEALRDEPNGLAYALGLRLGLRPGEAWALHWEDIDIDNGTVNVTRGIQRSGGRSSISDDLKTSASKRTIALPDDLTAWFTVHRAAQRVERIAADRWADDRLVFTGPTGNLVDPALSRNRLADICRRSKIDSIRPNELRHSCASLLSDEGVPNELIADLLGHTTTRMVDQTYRHRLRPVVDVAASASWAAAK